MNIETATYILNRELESVDRKYPISLKDAIKVLLAELTKLNRPDGFWHDDDHEGDISDLFTESGEGTVVKVGQAHVLPYIWVVVHRDAEGDDDSQEFATKEEAQAWKAKHFPNEEPSE